MGLLEDQAMPSLRAVTHDCVLCTFINRSSPDRGKWCGPSGQAAWTVPHVQNHTLLGHSSPASLVGRRVGPALLPSASFVLSVEMLPMPGAALSAYRTQQAVLSRCEERVYYQRKDIV
jgi:hypothetical protein